MSEFTLIVGKRIRKARKAKNLTLEELAERCGLHPAYIGQLERGVKNASLYTLEKIACVDAAECRCRVPCQEYHTGRFSGWRASIPLDFWDWH